MTRPSQILLIGIVYLYGAAIAAAKGFTWDWITFAAGVSVLILVSTSVHLANEYSDYDTDRLTSRTPFSGGSGALIDSSMPRIHALYWAWITLIIGLLLAFAFVLVGTLDLLSLLVLAGGAFFGWMYSLVPLAFAWRGWGELVNSSLGGLLLPLYGYSAIGGTIDWFPVYVSLPFFGLAFLNLLATTWPDRIADEKVGKRTLATRWDSHTLRILYWTIAIAAGTVLLVISLQIAAPIFWLSFAITPFVLWGGLTYTRSENPFPSVAAMVGLVVLQLIAWINLG
jgi:1,4-dihydroxy-2-naphthoate octaprenyltransferase